MGAIIKKNRKIFSYLMLFFGATGFIIFLLAGFYVLAGGILNSISTPLSSASQGALNAASGLESASQVSSGISDGFYSIAGIVGFQVLTWRPFESSSVYFENLGKGMENTGSDLKKTSDSLGSLGNELQNLSEIIGSLKTRVIVFVLLLYFSFLHLFMALMGYERLKQQL